MNKTKKKGPFERGGAMEAVTALIVRLMAHRHNSRLARMNDWLGLGEKMDGQSPGARQRERFDWFLAVYRLIHRHIEDRFKAAITYQENRRGRPVPGRSNQFEFLAVLERPFPLTAVGFTRDGARDNLVKLLGEHCSDDFFRLFMLAEEFMGGMQPGARQDVDMEILKLTIIFASPAARRQIMALTKRHMPGRSKRPSGRLVARQRLFRPPKSQRG